MGVARAEGGKLTPTNERGQDDISVLRALWRARRGREGPGDIGTQAEQVSCELTRVCTREKGLGVCRKASALIASSEERTQNGPPPSHPTFSSARCSYGPYTFTSLCILSVEKEVRLTQSSLFFPLTAIRPTTLTPETTISTPGSMASPVFCATSPTMSGPRAEPIRPRPATGG